MGGFGVSHRAILVLSVLFVAGCAHQGTAPGSVVRDPASAVAPDSPSAINRALEDTNPLLAEITEGGEKVPLQIPIEINRKVSEWIKFFTERERERTTRYFQRGEALRGHIEQILKDNDVPPELYYLAMIESGFVSHAKSRAKAVGVWQFMPGTGRNYGLEVSKRVDERRNWIKSTEAAASYLKDLNNVFGSWYLALAAYNAGEHRIVRSIMKGKTRDFWALAEQGLLPKETLNYVPKFLAAHIVGKNMKRFGFEVTVPAEDSWEPFETASVPANVRLADIAKTTDIPLNVLKRWNFDLIGGYTPSSKTGTVDIYVPKSFFAKYEVAKEEVAKLKGQRAASDQRVYASAKQGGGNRAFDVYIVRRGDNLYTISKRIGISVRTLMKVNGIRRGKLHPGQRLKYYQSTTANGGRAKSRAVATSQ